MIELGDKIRKYKKDVKGLDCDRLVWVIPADTSLATEKVVFRSEGLDSSGGTELLSMQAGRDGFYASSAYVKSKLLRFSPEYIVKNDLQSLFSKPMRIKYKLYAGGAGWGIGNPKAEEIEPMFKKPTIKETKKMSKTTQVISNIKTANVEAAKVTAKIAAGKALNTAVQSKIVPKLPIMVRGYAQTDIGKIVLANAVATALSYYAPNDAKAKMVSEAMIQSAMCDLMATIDVEGMVKEFLSSDAAERIVSVSE